MKKKRNIRNLNIYFILIIEVMVILFWGIIKANYHWDEYYSMGYAHYYSDSTPQNMYIWESDRFKKNEWVSVESYKELFVVDDENSLIHDDLSYSVPKVLTKKPYFAILNIVESLLSPGKMSKWSGIILNIPFVLVGLIFLYKIAYGISKNEKYSELVVLLYGLCGSTIGFAEYVRFYCFLHMLLIMALYFHYKMWEGANWKKNILYEVIALICIYMGYLSSELVVIWGGALVFSFSLVLLFRKKFFQFIYYFIPIIFGGVGYLYFKTDYIDMLLHSSKYINGDGRPVDLMMQNLNDLGVRNLLKGLFEYVHIIGTYVFGSVIILGIFVLLIVVLGINYIKKNGKILKKLSQINGFYYVMLLLVTIYSIFTILCNIWTARYFSLMFPELILLFFLSIYRLSEYTKKKNEIRITSYALVILGVIITFACIRIENIYPEDRDTIEKLQEYKDMSNVVCIENEDYQVLMECVNWMSSDSSIFFIEDMNSLPVEKTLDEILLWRYIDTPVSDEEKEELINSGYKSIECIGQTYTSYIYYCEK